MVNGVSPDSGRFWVKLLGSFGFSGMENVWNAYGKRPYDFGIAGG
jgi:hypothetical protein